jgi:hypothetical protein
VGVPPAFVPAPTRDNQIVAKFFSNQGWPGHRVAVSYRGPAAALVLPAQVWIFDHKTEAWYEVGAPGTLTPNRISYFDVVSLLDPPTTALDPATPSSGSHEVLLIVQPAGGDPGGEYVFGLGVDMSLF